MKALVTGASGFVGSRVARALLAQGWEVRALVRASSSPLNLRELPVEQVTGDLTDPASLERAAQGCQVLLHVAADYRLGSPRPAELYRSNVEGTRNVIQAAMRAGHTRIVYTSSVATMGIPTDGTPGDEATAVTLDHMIGHYKRSKFLGEQAALELTRAGAPVVIVNPSTPIGPGDIKPTPTGQIVLDAALGRTPAYVDTGLNIVHVDDVAAGHLLALDKGRIGERYILGGENLSLREILTQVTALVGRPPPRVRLPHGVVMPIAYISEGFARITGTSTRVTVESVRMSKKRMFFSSAKAVRELGYRHRPPQEAFVDAIAWLRDEGYLGKPPKKGHPEDQRHPASP